MSDTNSPVDRDGAGPADTDGNCPAVLLVGPREACSRIEKALRQNFSSLQITHQSLPGGAVAEREVDCVVVTDPVHVPAAQIRAATSPVILYTNDTAGLDDRSRATATAVVRRETTSGENLRDVIESVVSTPAGTLPVKRAHSILRAIDNPVVIFDDDGDIHQVNPAFERRSGYDAHSITGESLEVVFSEQEFSVTELIDSLEESGDSTAVTFETTMETVDADRIHVGCRVSQLTTGESGDFVAVLHDISELKERQQRLMRFARAVSHDLRNPMDVALGRAEMLPEIADVDEETERHLDEIYHSLKRMERLIEDVLTLTRQQDELVETTAISLEDTVEEAWNNVATGNAMLIVDTPIDIEAHRSRLCRLLENLFRNAIQHGGDEVTVSVTVTDGDDETMTVVVSDDGPGVLDENKSQIFEHGFTTAQEGTGLGLAIVNEVASAHGWEVTVTDSDAGGAQFELSGILPSNA